MCYTVRCYNADGEQFGEADNFDNFDDACIFAVDMSNDGEYLVDIECPDGTVVCVD